jgi:hypothetical protein
MLCVEWRWNYMRNVQDMAVFYYVGRALSSV